MRAAIVGVGFMGWIHYLAYQRCANAKLVAFCSRDANKRNGDWRGIQGNFGPPGEQIDVSGLSVCSSLDEMLADPQIDLVDICLPPHLHDEAVKKSLQAGKWVLCEKPLSLTAQQADSLVAQGDQKLMVAHILPFFPEYKLLCDAVATGRFGKLLGGRFKRIIGPPSWIPDFYDPLRIGGPLIDLHVHDAHLLRMLIGMPQSVHTRSRLHQDPSGTVTNVPEYVETIFNFADPAVLATAVSGVIGQPSRGFTHGYDVQFDKANLQFEVAVFGDGTVSQIPLTIAHQDGSVEHPECDSSDSIKVFVDELEAAAKAVDEGVIHPALSAAVAADAIRICEMQMPQA